MLLGVLGGCAVVPPASAAAPDVVGKQVSARQLLDRLKVAPEGAGAAYNRAGFKHWDRQSDGCTTRDVVLIAESTTAVSIGPRCKVFGGEWVSYYDGASWWDPADVDVDHLVPLGEAWRSGASKWPAGRREAYANDLKFPATLVAVTDNVNESKGDRDVASWLPPLAKMWCRYVTEWAQVKYRWRLTVDKAERSAARDVLSGACGNAPVVVPGRAW